MSLHDKKRSIDLLNCPSKPGKMPKEDKKEKKEDVEKDEKVEETKKPRVYKKRAKKYPVAKPKKAKNSYIKYCQEKRESVKEDFPDLKGAEITKKLSEMWGNLTEDEKEAYKPKKNGKKKVEDNEEKDEEKKSTKKETKKETKSEKKTPKKKGGK
ncbi:nuclear autoantigen Sp-100, putative [Entamoeba invadens IP1]|uniref:Nuclear autoantigen Sp-100, putative n=1 Tax=Entamoeba invadens IP1 TaxID=370355 RepID=A0A0A1UC68_ENTIV|nr:nuclear autoantigen Sp-100, putative [Entamoeba invadens IP1]ELP91298.1 nuclear autoantigen Sp-100, putative [Entamoeba invadens IP1]|eukprot:XP_004258069.1 nuclear autoantigen Sp-100, putative [Entamoeba invadens IP1]